MKNLIYSFLVAFCCLFSLDIAAQASRMEYPLIKCLENTPTNSFKPLKDLLLSSFVQTKFEHLNSVMQNSSSTKSVLKKGFSVDGEPLKVHANATVLNELATIDNGNLWTQALDKFESYEFEQAKKLFYQYCELNPADEKAKFYFALSQLYLGQYGSAANKLSVLNKSVSLKNDPSEQMFKDEIKFYFAWSALKVCDSPRMAIVLFNQLNYEGGKYQNIAKEMINLLRH